MESMRLRKIPSPLAKPVSAFLIRFPLGQLQSISISLSPSKLVDCDPPLAAETQLFGLNMREHDKTAIQEAGD